MSKQVEGMEKRKHIYRGVRMLYDRPVNGRYVVTCCVSVDGGPLPMTTRDGEAAERLGR